MRPTRLTSLTADINVTPLVDVCLVLLIIFMVVLPSMNGVSVQLPETAGKDSIEHRVLPVTIKEDGTVYLDTLVIRREELPAALLRLRETSAARPIAVRADKRVQYGDVATVLGACRDAGWEDVRLVTVKKP